MVSVGVIGLRNTGALEALELLTYDWHLRLLPRASFQPLPVVLIQVTESDIATLGHWPLKDASLAQALVMLTQGQPRVIGLDIYRNVPEPPGTLKLEEVLVRNRNIKTVMKFGGKDEHGIAPISVLKDSDQIGFNDILVDPGGVVRRGLLFLDDGENTFYSFGLRIALSYLEKEGITAQPDALDPQILRLGKATINPFGSYDGAYIGADARGYQFLLDFRDARAAFPSYSLMSLLSGKIPPEALNDKIVLIGTATESVKDFFYSPHSRGLHLSQHITGVELHGYIVTQLIRLSQGESPPLSTMNEWQRWIWILLWGLTGGATGSRVRSPWRFSLIATGSLIALAMLVYFSLVYGWWIPLVPPATAWIISAAMVTAYMSNREKRDRALLMQLFSKHVSSEVAETIWNEREQFFEGGRPRSQKLIVTVMFIDLKGFTTVSEKLDPETLINWLNTYLEAMAQLVIEHGGVVDDYTGDGLKADFGVPLPRTSEAEIGCDALNAVNCALGMEKELKRLNLLWQEHQLPTTSMRIGIFTGPVVACSLGSADRMKYTTIGDTINIASRLESFDKDSIGNDFPDSPCRILVGEATLCYLNNRFRAERIGNVELKGKRQKITVFRLLSRWDEQPSYDNKEGLL